MAFDLTAHLKTQERARAAGMIRQACREISACACPQKRWEAMRLLRGMQRSIA